MQTISKRLFVKIIAYVPFA